VADVIALFSGGLDSTTLLYQLRAEGHSLRALSVDYGQRHGRHELACARELAAEFGIDWRPLDLTSLVQFFGQNSLTNSTVAVPDGAYSTDTMAKTLVPNRNMVLLSVAIAWAIDTSSTAVAFGAHGGTYTPYPDCRPAFATAMDSTARVCHTTPIEVWAPFVHWSKADIVKRGAELGVPFERTWSCYRGGKQHCGQCGTCLDRRAAFLESGVPDPTEYEVV
jgi:7-cyano-7-deazaguanine synthase